MITNYLVPIDDRARDLLCSFHRAGCSENAAAADDLEKWRAYRRHSLRIEEIRRAPTGACIALDQAEFELLGELPA